MTNRKKRVTKPAAYGHRRYDSVCYLYISDEAYFNWLSRVTDDNPDYAKTT